jgi:hypothetical protein
MDAGCRSYVAGGRLPKANGASAMVFELHMVLATQCDNNLLSQRSYIQAFIVVKCKCRMYTHLHRHMVSSNILALTACM